MYPKVVQKLNQTNTNFNSQVCNSPNDAKSLPRQGWGRILDYYPLSNICPTCYWEEEVFKTSDIGPSVLNHGLALDEVRINYLIFEANNRSNFCITPV